MCNILPHFPLRIYVVVHDELFTTQKILLSLYFYMNVKHGYFIFYFIFKLIPWASKFSPCDVAVATVISGIHFQENSKLLSCVKSIPKEHMLIIKGKKHI
jgi:hypothetical protein